MEGNSLRIHTQAERIQKKHAIRVIPRYSNTERDYHAVRTCSEIFEQVPGTNQAE